MPFNLEEYYGRPSAIKSCYSTGLPVSKNGLHTPTGPESVIELFDPTIGHYSVIFTSLERYFSFEEDKNQITGLVTREVTISTAVVGLQTSSRTSNICPDGNCMWSFVDETNELAHVFRAHPFM